VTEVWAPADVKADGLSRQVGGLLRPGPEGDPAQEQKDPRCKPVANRTRLPAAAQRDTEELRALPMDPHALYEAVSKRVGYVGSPSNPGLTMLELTRLTTASASPLLTPRRIAALFRSMTYVPGVRLAGPGRDLLGRRGIVLEWSWNTGEVQQVIIDPHDGQVLGNRVVFTQDTETTQIRIAPHEPLKVTGSSARLVPAGSRWLDKATVTGVVDRIGQRP
jgi:hypothetical protein